MGKKPSGLATFVGPSVSPAEAQQLMPDATVLPPIARGDLIRAREAGARVILVIDGVFAHRMAVPPSEIIEVIRDGAHVIGCSSMGAIRAAECWPGGMRGVGAVYRLFRMQAIESDDEVAVTTNPDRGFAALSIALVNVRFAARNLARRGVATAEQARHIVEVATRIFFAERVWPNILQQAEIPDPDGEIARSCRRDDIKHRDAVAALKRTWAQWKGGAFPPERKKADAVKVRLERYSGHDPYLGMKPAQVRMGLVKWLFGTGRYQRYIWPLVVDAKAFVKEPIGDRNRAERVRGRLVTALSESLSDIKALSRRLLKEVEFMEELESEVMHWHAIQRLAAAATADLASVPQARVRDEVAIAHGYRDWLELVGDVEGDAIFGVIPMEWIVGACREIALARSVLA
jgi:hypothetical protein